MTLEQYAYLSQILGVIVVTATLIYLAIQVRQGAALLRSESRQAQVVNDQSNIIQFIEHPELGRIFSTKDTPSFEEKTQLAFWINLSMRAREHEWMQYQTGNLDEDTWVSYRRVILFTLGTERARNLWAISEPAFNAAFVEMVREFIRENPPADTWAQLDAVA